MKYSLVLLKNPSGSFSFVGSVPSALAYTSLNGEAISAAYITEQLMLPASFRAMKKRSWVTKQLALQEAEALGFKVDQICEN